ncbi:MAG: stage II sporulation protein M [Thermodesulfobacteriota bacterium]
MIVNLDRFLVEERPYWVELERLLDRLEKDPDRRMDLDSIKRFHYLYQRASADLAKIMTFSTEPETRRYLESLVERAYGEIHETRAKPHRLALGRWFTRTLPQTFRRRVQAFWLSLAVMATGFLFGGLAITFDPEAKEVLMPFPHLQASPSQRVAEEESAGERDRLSGFKSRFSSYLMTHNTKVSILTLALGMTWGIGTLIVLFSNGVMLGAVALDYVLDGQARFLLGWLLPHGSIEIPAIILAGQAGLVLAGALIGWGRPVSLRVRLREVSGDLVTLIFGVAVFLVWAGLVEAFLSQYHEPVLPYEFKIVFGVAELTFLFWFLAKAGSSPERRKPR